MKKILAIALGLFLAACSKTNTDSIKGSEYILLDAPEGMEISLSFDQNDPKFFGQAVNRYFGNYEKDGNKIKFMAIGSTMMAAPEPMMNAETGYFKNLNQIDTITFENDTLVLSGKDTNMKFKKSEKEKEPLTK